MTFSISYGKEYEDFQIAAASQIERQEWVDALSKCIQNTKVAAKEETKQPADAEEIDLKAAERVVAIYDYDSQEANELTLKTNDEIIIVKRYPNSDWCKGKLGNKIGLFPINFTKSATATTALRKAKAIYDYEATEDNELSFKEGDIISIISEEMAGWCVGELNGRKGMFPVNFVQQISNK